MNSGAARAEHISLETTEIDISAKPARPPHRKVRETYVLRSALRECSTELSLLEDDYLKVHTERPRTEPKKFVIDLRLLNSQPVRTSHIAWPWLSMSALSLIATCVALWWMSATPGPFYATAAFALACITTTAAIGTALLGVRFTTESLSFTSVHGGATVVSVVGGPGSTQDGKAFFVAVIKGIGAAKAARAQPNKQQLLRDEMREHHRLCELGVISEADYEASKSRILKAHA